MKFLKSIRRFFTLFVLKLTPSGRKEIMYDSALKNMKEAHTLTNLEKRMLKSQVNFYVNGLLRRRKLTPHHLGQLVNSKFGKELAAAGLAYNTKLYKVV